jgi:pimeloyl-ACP methyl ester carboxylesterase
MNLGEDLMQKDFIPKSFLILSFTASLLSAGCKSRNYNSSEISQSKTVNEKATLHSSEQTTQASPNIPKDVLQKWELMRALHPGRLQNGCEPTRYSPPAGVKYRGVAVLLHGFSACPGQYELLGPQLARAGYEVLVPLYPGHGRIPLQMSPRKDDVEFVPVNPVPWAAFTREVNELVQSFKGEKVLVGLSLGSNIALRAVQFAPDLYDRVYVMSPKLRSEASFFSGLLHDQIKVFGIEEFILDGKAGWPICEKEESLPPHNRPGFCYMQNKHGIAMLDFGKNVIDAAQENGKRGTRYRTQIQFVLSHSDNGTCNDAAREVLTGLQKGNNKAMVCVMPKEVPHSMFSLRDKPYEKPWVPALFDSVETFLTTGTPVAGSSQSFTDCALQW